MLSPSKEGMPGHRASARWFALVSIVLVTILLPACRNRGAFLPERISAIWYEELTHERIPLDIAVVEPILRRTVCKERIMTHWPRGAAMGNGLIVAGETGEVFIVLFEIPKMLNVTGKGRGLYFSVTAEDHAVLMEMARAARARIAHPFSPEKTRRP